MLSVRDHRELRAAVLALKRADRDLRRDINRATTQTMNPVWRSVVEANATYRLDAQVLAKGARIKAGNPPAAIAANSRRRLRGGLIPANDFAGVEFGAPQHRKRTYNRRGKGGTHKVTRHTTRQLPAPAPKGRVVYPAFADIAPRMVSLWVQTIVRTYNRAAEGGS